jgi:AcrR family transcriptional regulator
MGVVTRTRLDLRAVARTLADHPRDSITMAEIAAHLAVAKPTLYRMAGSKAALLDACLDAEAERLLDHLREASSFAAILAALDRYAGDSPGGFVLLFERPAAGADVRVRRAEAWLADVAGCAPTVAAGLLGAAAAIVATARRETGALDAAATAGEFAAALVRNGA